MRSGVSFPSYAGQGTWSAGTATTFDADYPVTNLSDLKRITRKAKVAGATTYAFFNLTFAAFRTINFCAMLNHNIVAPTKWRMRFYAEAVANIANTPLLDTGLIDVWPSGSAPISGLPAVTPFVFPASASVRTGILAVEIAAGLPEIGGFECGGWWEWTDVAVPRELGISGNGTQEDMGGGVVHAMKEWSPRLIKGTRSVVDQSEIETTALDFQREKRLSQPFVFLTDFDDPTTWPREAVLVKNVTIPPSQIFDVDVGRFAFEFREHIG